MRKINWLNRHAHTALLFFRDADCGQELISMTDLYRASDIKAAYQTVSHGVRVLEENGLMTKQSLTVYFDNGMKHRTFKAMRNRMSGDDLERLTELTDKVYQSSHSVEMVAAVATITGMHTTGTLKNKNDWFTLQDYEACLKAPTQKCRYRRAPTDAVGLIEYDVSGMRYRRNDRAIDIEPLVTEIDSIIHGYRKS